MVRSLVVFLTAAALLRGEAHTMTLRQAVDRALAQNPDVMLARLDEQKAAQSVRIARDPFTPRLDVGSGLAWTNGYPQSVDGGAPSVITAKASQFLFNKPQAYAIAQSRENVRGAGFATASKREDVAFRTASFYLDLDRAVKLSEMARKQVESLEKVAQTAKSRVAEGYELPVEEKRADVELKRAQQRLETIESDQEVGERSLAVLLGYPPEDRVATVADQSISDKLPVSEGDALAEAVASNKDLRRLESALAAKGLEIKGDKAQRLPRADLVAQYALFSRFNNLDEYFRKFQTNNEELGVSFVIPLLPGPGVNAQVAQAEEESAKIRIEYQSAKSRLALDIHQAYQDIRKARTANELAQADLDLARESLTVLLAQMSEGRASLRQVEETRLIENEKWLAFYDAQYAMERARLSVLRLTGELVASLR